jgi:hypothetical protein
VKSESAGDEVCHHYSKLAAVSDADSSLVRLERSVVKECGEHLEGSAGTVLAEAAAKIEDQEDEHLYHTKGWCRELWVKALGLTAVLPLPEEVQKVKTAIGTARAEQAAETAR